MKNLYDIKFGNRIYFIPKEKVERIEVLIDRQKTEDVEVEVYIIRLFAKDLNLLVDKTFTNMKDVKEWIG